MTAVKQNTKRSKWALDFAHKSVTLILNLQFCNLKYCDY